MLKLTLDWNCIIEVEEGRAQKSAVLSLVEGHRNGICETALLATSASENTKSRVFPGNADLFKSRVDAAGLSDLTIVLTPCIISLTYIDWAFCVDGPHFDEFVPKLWASMFPAFEQDARRHLPEGALLDDHSIQSDHLADWRNRWCDVMSAYSHIVSKRDVFVTLNTRDFQRNEAALVALGIGKILTPDETVALLGHL